MQSSRNFKNRLRVLFDVLIDYALAAVAIYFIGATFFLMFTMLMGCSTYQHSSVDNLSGRAHGAQIEGQARRDLMPDCRKLRVNPCLKQ
jgi:hypothetical protein